MSKLIGVYGASGFGREVMPMVRQQYPSEEFRCFFIDDESNNSIVNGQPIITYNEFLKMESDSKMICIAIADSNIRKTLSKKCQQDKVELISVIANNAVIMDSVTISNGAIISPFCTITSNVQIGCGFQANIYSYVAHDCEIGDYVTFAPSVKCNGNVRVEDGAYLGTGAILKQGKLGKPLVIGKGAVIGMGAIVTKDVAPGDVVFGNPARSIKRMK